MQRTGVIVAGIVMLVALTLPAFAAGPEWPAGPPAPHAHLLVLDSGHCVDLASNQVVPRNAQHAHLHVGQAGDAQEIAGNSVIPAFEWANCAAYLADPDNQ